MDNTTAVVITEEEKEILQEIMNIAFGKAAADLAEFIDIYIDLSVPYIKVMNPSDLPGYIKKEINDDSNFSIVEQKYWGKFKGDALLIFPSSSSKGLLSLFDPERDCGYGSDTIDFLERESMMEVGNILIGACVGKIAEVLNDSVTYTPPRVIIETQPLDSFSDFKFDKDSSIILLKTAFNFKSFDVDGFLFLVTSSCSVGWLKSALSDFMEQY